MIDYKKINKILICRLSSLGDILLVSPVIDSIKSQNSKIQIDFLLKQKFIDTLKVNPKIQNIIEYDNFEYFELRKKIILEKYDLIIDLQNNLRTKLLFFLSGIKRRSVNKPRIKKQLLVKFKINLINENFSIPKLYASAANVNLSGEDKLSFYTETGRLTRIDGAKKTIGFCPGAKHFTKIWPEEYFTELGNILARFGFKLLLLGGSMEKNLCERLRTKIPNSIDCSNQDDLFGTAQQMRNCDLIVTNDSALMHLATSINIPIVAIFGSSVKEFGFSPFNVDYTIIQNAGLNCRPCSHIGRKNCPRKHFQCMLDIKPKLVFEKIKWMLKIDE